VLSAGAPDGPCVTLRQLQQMSPCDLEQLFAHADLGEPPLGCLRGYVLVMTGKHCPYASARMANLAWKGKCFAPDGGIVNRWPCCKAIRSCAAPGASWYDGRPSLVI